MSPHGDTEDFDQLTNELTDKDEQGSLRFRDALGYLVEALDRSLFRHRFPKVCHLGWWLLNGGKQ